MTRTEFFEKLDAWTKQDKYRTARIIINDNWEGDISAYICSPEGSAHVTPENFTLDVKDGAKAERRKQFEELQKEFA